MTKTTFPLTGIIFFWAEVCLQPSELLTPLNYIAFSMADITFKVTDSSMKHDYLFIVLDNFFGSRDHWKYILLVEITFHWREHFCTGSDHFSLA